MLARRSKRRGAMLVEFAVVSIVAFLFIFGILEYCRLVFLLQTTTNAAREGARFASVRTGDDTTTEQVIDEVNHRMASRQKELSDYTVEVFQADPSTGAPAADPDWKNTAFGNVVAVRITGNYKPILPGLLLIGNSIPIRVTAMMNSEAN